MLRAVRQEVSMRILMATATATVLMSAALSSSAFVTPAFAASPQQSKMQQCAAQWQDLKKANKTGGQDYKTFSAGCMKAAAPAPIAAATTAKPAAALAATSGKMSQQDRMKACAAQWNTMKAQNKTGGQTYKQFASQCLKAH
jgi:uncharacterized protein (DUF2345 family)